MGYQCLHCSRTFSTPFGLKRHISDRHQYIANEGESSQSNLLPVLVRDNIQGKFQCPGHVLDIVPDMSRPSVPSKYPIIFRYNKRFKLTYLSQY